MTEEQVVCPKEQSPEPRPGESGETNHALYRVAIPRPDRSDPLQFYGLP